MRGRARIGRVGTAALAVVVLSLALSGCIGFKGHPKGKQLSAHAVQVSFKGCAAGSNHCSDDGPSSGGDMRLLAAVRVPVGTVGPLTIKPKGLGEKLKPDSSYGDELTAKATTPPGTIWMAYSSKSFDYQGDPVSAKAVLQFGLPNHPGKTFKYRPVIGGMSTAVDDDPVDCGTDIFTGAGGNATCIDAPDNPPGVDSSLKIKLD